MKIKFYHLLLAVYTIGGLSAIIVSLLMNMNREDVGFAFFIVSALFMLLVYLSKKYDPTLGVVDKRLFHASILAWPLVFLISLAFLFESFRIYYLNLGYFLSIACLTLIISYQILSTVKFTKFTVFTVLSETIILSFYMGASMITLFPAPIGGDSIVHVPYISSILSSGNLQSYIYAGQYQNFPVYQLSFALIMLLSNVDILTVEMVLLLVQILFTVFVYILIKKAFDQKTALMAFLLINFSTQIITPRFSFYPSNFFIILFMLLVFVLLNFGKNKLMLNYINNYEQGDEQPAKGIYPKLRRFVSHGINSLINFKSFKMDYVVYLLIIVINLSHPIFAFITTCAVILIYAVSRFIKAHEIMDIKMVLLSIAMLIIQWLRPYYAPDLKSPFSMLAILISGAFTEQYAVTKVTLSPYYNFIDVMLYELGFVMLMALGVCGALWILRDTGNNAKNYSIDNIGVKKLLSYFTLLLVPLPYVIAVIFPDLLPDRLFVYITLFIGIFAAVTLVTFYKSINNSILKCVVILAVPFIIFFSITTPICNTNSHIYSQDMAGKSTLTNTEVGGRDFIRQYVNFSDFSANSVYADFITLMPNVYGNYLNPSKIYTGQVLMVRNYDMDKGFSIPLFGKSGKLEDHIMPNETFVNYTNHLNKLYENGEVRAFY